MANYTDANLSDLVKSTGYSSRITELCLIEDIREARAEVEQLKAQLALLTE